MERRLQPDPQVITESLAVLASMPADLRAAARGHADAELSQAPGSGWSVVEILAHVRGCFDVCSFSILAMLAEDEPLLALIDPRKWARAAGYAGQTFSRSLVAFEIGRGEFMEVLHALSDEGWSRMVDIGGRRHSVYSQTRRMAKHEVEHLEQIRGLLR